MLPSDQSPVSHASPCPLLLQRCGVSAAGLAMLLLALTELGIFTALPALFAQLMLPLALLQLAAGLTPRPAAGLSPASILLFALGCFWLSLLGLLALPLAGIGTPPAVGVLPSHLGFWGLFLFLLRGAKPLPEPLRLLCNLLPVQLGATAIALALSSPEIRLASGLIGLVCGLRVMTTASTRRTRP